MSSLSGLDAMQAVEIQTHDFTHQRRLDLMSGRRKKWTLALFLLSALSILSFAYFSPPMVKEEILHFDEKGMISNIRKMTMKVRRFSFMNSFVTYDVRFSNTSNAAEETNVSLSLSSKFIKNSRKIEKSHFYTVPSVNKTRLLTKRSIDFSELELTSILKMASKKGINGDFILRYADPTYSILEILIRSFFFIAGVSMFISLMLQSSMDSEYPYRYRAVCLLSALIIIGSNPFYLLHFFSDGVLFEAIDRAIFSCLIVVFAYVLNSSMARQGKVACIAYGFSGISVAVIAAKLFLESAKINGQGPSTLAQCVLSTLAVLLFNYRAKETVKMEKELLVSVGVANSAIMWLLFLHMGEGQYIFQLLTQLTTATFLVFLNWPVDADSTDEIPSDAVDSGAVLDAL